jgi:hypothetical protein
MKGRIPHLLAVAVLTLTGARAAAADDADAAITGTILHFVDALEAGDARALEQLIVAESPAQEQMRKLFCDLAAAQKSLERAAIKKFDAEGKRFQCGFDLIAGLPDRKLLATAKVIYDEPNRFVHVEKSGELLPMSLHRNRQGQWQVVVELIEQDADEADPYPYPPFYNPQGKSWLSQLANIHQTRYKAIIEAFGQTQARIENGQLATAAAAQRELLDKLSAASAGAVKARTTLPSGRTKERQ